MIIIDACIAVKWFRKEADADKATALLRSRRKLIAPDLIRIEVAAALTRFIRTQEISASRVTTLLADWQQALLAGAVSLEPTQHDFERATEISVKHEHQLQDCLYVALAQRLDMPLITSDEKLLKKAGEMPCMIQSLCEASY